MYAPFLNIEHFHDKVMMSLCKANNNVQFSDLKLVYADNIYNWFLLQVRTEKLKMGEGEYW